jgi:hypothetical protein
MNDDTLTVAKLIAILSKMPQDLPVEMAMNMEYQSEVSADMVEVQEYDGRRYLCITDTPDNCFFDDTVYNEDGSIRAKYLADDGEIRYEDTNEIATA